MVDLTTTAEGYFLGHGDGLPVYYKRWIPKQAPRGRILAFHGLGEHIDRYDELFTHFACEGFVVSGFDYRGHGKSFKKREEDKCAPRLNVQGHCRIRDLHEDMIILERLDKTEDEKGLPLFYFGHSLGGLTALSFAADFHHLDGFSGVIASAPALRFTTPVPAYAKVALLATGIPLIARYTDANNLEIEGLCSSKDVRQKYVNDELTHERISLGLLADILEKEKAMFRCAGKFPHPVFICHLEGDKFTDYSGSKEFIDRISSKDKTLKTYRGSYGHELHNEPELKGELFPLISGWMKQRSEDA